MGQLCLSACPAQGRAVLPAVWLSWLLEDLWRRSVTRWWCYFGMIGSLAPPYLCFSWLQGTVLLSACSFERECRREPSPLCPRLCSPSVSCPQEGLLMFAGQFVWQPSSAPYIQHPLPPVCLHVNPTFFASQPRLRKLHCRPQESSSAQPPDSLTAFT